MKTYILIPVWKYEDFSSDNKKEWKQWWDIPHYFMKIFHSKKEIENYLNKLNNSPNLKEMDKTLHSKLHTIMSNEVFEKYKNDTNTALKITFNYKDIQWVVITCNDDVSKENRIGIMQKCYDKKTDKYKWKYISYFGGKVWRDDLLFRLGYANVN